MIDLHRKYEVCPSLTVVLDERFPLLESLCPVDSNQREKAAVVLSLLRIALEGEFEDGF